MHLPMLQDFLILLGLSMVVVFVLQRLKLPSILGFLVTGILIGPHGFGLLNESEQIEAISEIGVILLLFVIGMELSIKQLVSIKKYGLHWRYAASWTDRDCLRPHLLFVGQYLERNPVRGFSFFLVQYRNCAESIARPQ